MNHAIQFDKKELVSKSFLVESEGGKMRIFATLKDAVKAANSSTDIVSLVETYQVTHKTRLS